MDRKEKLEILQKLDEKKLKNDVLISLFRTMEFNDVIDYHGSVEEGKDLIFFEENKIGEREYIAVQAKAVKIHGRVGEKGNASEVLTQAQQAFTSTFVDVYDGKEKRVDKVFIVSSHEIDSSAKESIRGTLQSINIFKHISFIEGDKLVELIDRYMPSLFWDEYDYFKKYFDALKTDFETIKDISAIGQKEPVPLERIYVSLRLVELGRFGYSDVQHSFMKAMSDKFAKEIDSNKAKFYEYGRFAQKGGMRKREFIDEAKKMVEARNVRTPGYNPDVGMPQGQRYLMPYMMNHTDIMLHPDKLVIVGVPGSGKTTLLKHLALKTCKENLEKQERTCVPIPITLREFSESEKDLRQFIDAVFEKYQFPRAKEFVENDLKKGKCQLLFDGFDELATKERQEKIAEQIRKFIEKYPKCQFIVTSRIAGYHDELRGFTKLELMEFDDNQIKKFVKKWFGESDPEKAKLMLAAIKKNEQIKTLARNPLMIAIIAIIYEEDSKLPQKRADLYKRCVEVLLSKWDVQKRLKYKYSSEKKEFILRKLAFYAHSNNKRVMTEKEVLREMLRYFPQIKLKKGDARPFLDEIWQRSYLLRQISMNSYDFLHLSFQEYFTAIELKEQEDGLSTIINHLHEPWWEEPILLYAGINKDATALIKRIQKEVPEDIFYSNLMLFGKCVADAEFTKPSLREEIVNDLWSLCQTAEFAPLKEKAINVLALIKPDTLIDSLIKELKAKKSEVRWSAADALGRIGSEKAVEPLITALTTAKGSAVRWSAADALGRIGSEKAIEPLLKALTTAEASAVRGSAADALGNIGDNQAVEPLKKALKDEGEFVGEKVKDKAFTSLEKISRRIKMRITMEPT